MIFVIRKEDIRIHENIKDKTFCMVYYKGNEKYTSETYKMNDYKGKKDEFDKILNKFKKDIKELSKRNFFKEKITQNQFCFYGVATAFQFDKQQSLKNGIRQEKNI